MSIMTFINGNQNVWKDTFQRGAYQWLNNIKCIVQCMNLELNKVKPLITQEDMPQGINLKLCKLPSVVELNT